MGYIGAHGVAALHRYKYSGVDHSYLCQIRAPTFLDSICQSLPTMDATKPDNANGIYVCSHVFPARLYIYSPQLDSSLPRWVHFAHGLLLFLYQTFDVVDGKQARRTNSSSPLGELFDHGCDALACAFEAMAFGSTAMCELFRFMGYLSYSVLWSYMGTLFHKHTYSSGYQWAYRGSCTYMSATSSQPLLVLNGGLSSWGESIPLFSWVPFVNEIQTSRAVLYMMIAFAVIPTVALNVSNVHKVVQAKKH